MEKTSVFTLGGCGAKLGCAAEDCFRGTCRRHKHAPVVTNTRGPGTGLAEEQGTAMCARALKLVPSPRAAQSGARHMCVRARRLRYRSSSGVARCSKTSVGAGIEARSFSYLILEV
eukprot:1074100-Pyramimonas_sp.AAC.3